MNLTIYIWKLTLPFKGMRQGLVGDAKVYYKMKTKKTKTIMRIHRKVYRKTFIFICVDRRLLFHNRELWGREFSGRVYRAVNAQVKTLVLHEHL